MFRKILRKRGGENCVKGVKGSSFLLSSSFSFMFDVGDFGGGGRVRTRNTLHIVGARKSSICYNAVEGRER